MITIVIEWHEIVAVLVAWIAVVMVKRWIMLDDEKPKARQDQGGY